MNGGFLSLNSGEGLRFDAGDLVLQAFETWELVDALSFHFLNGGDSSRNSVIHFPLHFLKQIRQCRVLLLHHYSRLIQEALEDIVRLVRYFTVLLAYKVFWLLGHH